MARINKMMRTRRRREGAVLGMDGGLWIDFSRWADFSSVGRMGAITVDSLQLHNLFYFSLQSKVLSEMMRLLTQTSILLYNLVN